MLYFAYGSNLHPKRLQARLGGVELIGPATCHGRRLAFHKRGQDGSAKCDAPADPSPRADVHGAIYRIDNDALRLLDRFEGRGLGYEREEIRVDSGDEEIAAMTYMAQIEFIDETLNPFDWYKALVLAGARYHGFPQAYIARIEALSAIVDNDPQRAKLNLSSLKG